MDDTGTANTYVITLANAPSAYAEYQMFRFKAKTSNTGASTLNVCGLGTVALVKDVNVALVTGDILAGQIITAIFNGTNFQIVPDYSTQLGLKAPLASPTFTGMIIASNATFNGANAGIEIGSVSVPNSPYVDFHSSGNNIDYDARIIANGGSSTIGQGTLTLVAGTVVTPGLTLTGDIISDGNERRFKASQGWGLAVNSGGIDAYDWTNSRSVFQYGPTGNSLQLMGTSGTVTTKNNTLDDGTGNMKVGGQYPFLLSSAGMSANQNRSWGALVQYNEGIGIQGFKNAGATSNPIFGVSTNDSVGYFSVNNGGSVTTKNNTLDNGSGGATFANSISVVNELAVNSSGDAILLLENTASPTTAFRRKLIYSTNNVNNGNNWLLRQIRPSDGASIDYQLGTGTEPAYSSYGICTTFNEPSSLVTNGYKKHADGTIIQWGEVSVVAGNGCVVTLPIAFPNGCLNASATPNNSTSSTTAQAYNITTTTITVMCNATGGLFWMAIGH
jgi:hypothetical protein